VYVFALDIFCLEKVTNLTSRRRTNSSVPIHYETFLCSDSDIVKGHLFNFQLEINCGNAVRKRELEALNSVAHIFKGERK